MQGPAEAEDEKAGEAAGDGFESASYDANGSRELALSGGWQTVGVGPGLTRREVVRRRLFRVRCASWLQRSTLDARATSASNDFSATHVTHTTHTQTKQSGRRGQ